MAKDLVRGAGVGRPGAIKKAAKKSALKKHAAKHVAKHAKKSAKKSAKKAAKKGAAQTAERLRGEGAGVELQRTFHHMQRAQAVVSLLEQDSGGDLRMLLDCGIALYRQGADARAGSNVLCAFGLLRAAEHLGMAGLYVARAEHRLELAAPTLTEVERHLEELGPRLDDLAPAKRPYGRRLGDMARELLRRAKSAADDPHLSYELTMAAEGICSALEAVL